MDTFAKKFCFQKKCLCRVVFLISSLIIWINLLEVPSQEEVVSAKSSPILTAQTCSAELLQCRMSVTHSPNCHKWHAPRRHVFSQVPPFHSLLAESVPAVLLFNFNLGLSQLLDQPLDVAYPILHCHNPVQALKKVSPAASGRLEQHLTGNGFPQEEVLSAESPHPSLSEHCPSTAAAQAINKDYTQTLS